MKTIKINDGLQKIIDYRGKTPPKSATGITLISAANVKSGTLDFSRREFISEEDYANWTTRGFTKPGDVLFTTEAPTAEVAIYPEGGTYQISRRVIALRTDEKILHNLYLFYLLQSPLVKQRMTSANRGSTVPRLLKTDITQFIIEVPDYLQQKEIAKTLCCLDRKIENLRKQNETLEAIAQTLFKRWFVDFEFPNADGKPYKSSGGAMEPSELGDIPSGWRVGELGDVIDNYDRKRIPLSSSERDLRKGSYPYYGASSVMDYIDDYIFDGTYVLMGEDGTVIDDRGFPVLQYVFGKFWANNHAHILQGKSCYSTNILYLLLKRTRINNIVTGAVQPKINQANMNSIDLVIPDEKTLLKLDSVISSIFDKIKINVTHIQTLTQTRDVLLPKLMSGKLRIKT